MHTQNREKAPGIHIVPTGESKFPGHQKDKTNDRI